MQDFEFDARVIGNGRAGGALTVALRDAGWSVDGPLDRSFDPSTVARNTRLLVLAVPDGAIRDVSMAIRPGDAVLAHLAGSLGLRAMPLHASVAAIHPLVALPDPIRGAAALRGAYFAVTADTTASEAAAADVVAALDGQVVAVADGDRIVYHAAAAIAANHLVALLGQVDRIAASIGVPLEAYIDLARGALDNVAEVGPAAALTGPVARGDWDTVARHLAALPEVERAAYSTMADAARRLAESPTSGAVA